ncbi:hypothetical protein DAEQUDRAFT_727364 [Daedalea quercina L-15889]|uniref:Uncharacterized protein n=1 Tax=Daedalea quercina L-15889 TaxID=1314783 RepID=A0A165Q2X1_9APHY|nr:hypothetical protein DAEQUDRAFT_727364 [Daedalea quercina L-15889]
MDWFYNLRTHYFSDDDEDDISPDGEQTTTSDDGSLLAELDLSSRKDVAQHQSNPWTIAKINATTRKTTTNANAQKTHPINVPKRMSPDNSTTALRPKDRAILDVNKAKCTPAALKVKALEQIKANRSPEGVHIAADLGESAAITRRIASPYQAVPLDGHIRRMSPVEAHRLDKQAHDMSRPPSVGNDLISQRYTGFQNILHILDAIASSTVPGFLTKTRLLPTIWPLQGVAVIRFRRREQCGTGMNTSRRVAVAKISRP